MIMDQIKEAGWAKFKPVHGQPITEKDIKKVFRMVDMDKSGAISQLVTGIVITFKVFIQYNLYQELKMGLKYLAKRYGIKDVNIFKWKCKGPFFMLQMKTWKDAVKEADSDNDGKLTFSEFQYAVKLAEQKMTAKSEPTE